MSSESLNIGELASIAKIWISGAESDEVSGVVARLQEMAESLAECELPGETVSDTAFEKAVTTIDELREDIPNQAVEVEKLFEQSPSAGGDGFTIPRLLE